MNVNISLGIFLMIIAELCFTIMWAAVKWSGEQLPVFQIAFFRGLVTVVVVGLIMIRRNVSFCVKNKRSLLGRCVTGYISMIMIFFTLTKVGMGNTVTLLHTSPIFVAVLSPLVLGEHAKKSLLIWVLVAFLGVIFVMKPDANIFQNYSTLALLGGLLAGIAYISIRHLHRTENTLRITFYFALFVCLVSFPLMMSSYTKPSLSGWMGMLAAGVAGTLAQIFITHAYKCGPANILTPFNNTAILFSFVLGWFVWKETPDSMAIAGSILIIISIAAISLIVNRKEIPKVLPRIGETT